MPDILIWGMEMPENDSISVALRSDGKIEDVMGCYIGTAVELPPHGDLISKQAALAALYSDYAYAAMDIIEKEVPVVVPAERGDADA